MAEIVGKKFDTEKVDMDLLSPYALEKVAAVMTYGKTKYGRDNWRGGIIFSRLLAAVMRHINAYRKGETFDPETGLSHLSHASCGLMMLLEFEETRPDLDDRFLKEKVEETVVALAPELKTVAPDLKELVKFPVGEVVKHINNDVEVTVQGTYFDVNLKPLLFVKDTDNKVFAVDPNFYSSIYTNGAKSV